MRDLAQSLESQMFKCELCKLLGTMFSYSVELLNVSEPQFLHLKSGHLGCFRIKFVSVSVVLTTEPGI